MTDRIALFVAASAVGMALVVSPLAPVSAQAGADPLDCGADVVDTSGLLNVADVEDVITNAVPDGPQVVVRAYDSVPDGDLAATIDQLIGACYLNDNDVTDPNVVILGLSIEDRRSDLLVGDRWIGAVGDVTVIRSDVMDARFVEGDYTSGMTDAVSLIGSRIDAGSDEIGSESVDEPEVSAAVGVDGERAGEGGGIGPVTAGAGLVVLGGGAAAVAYGSRRRRLVTARRELEGSLVGPMNRLGSLRERHERALVQADVWDKTVAGTTRDRLVSLRAELDDAANNTDSAAAVISRILPEGPNGADFATAERAKSQVVSLSRAIDYQEETLDHLVALGGHLDHLRVAVPAKKSLLEEELVAASEVANQRSEQGWAVSSQVKKLDRLNSNLSALSFDGLSLDWLDLSDRVEAAEAELFAAEHYLQALPSRLESLKKWSDELESAIAQERVRSDDVRRRFSNVAALHARDSWQWAAEHPELALRELQQAEQIRVGVTEDRLAAQQFDDAGRELERSGLHVITADDYLDQIEDLMVDLDTAHVEAAQLVDQSRQILIDLTNFVKTHSDDLDKATRAAPDDLQQVLDGLEAELRQVKPNFLRVAETAYGTNRQIDELLASAEDQRAQMHALRREAQRETARAARAVARARRALGWELIQSTAGATLDRLEESLVNPPEDPAAQIEHAAGIADSALAVQERIIARRRRSGTWIVIGGGNSGHWGSPGSGGFGGGFGGGGGGSFGGGFGGGGGGSFGSGGFGGGGGHTFGGGRSSGGF